MNDINKQEIIDKYSKIDLRLLRKDYSFFWLPFFSFTVPFLGCVVIFHYADSESRWIGFAFLLLILSIYGFYLVLRPLILRILIPVILFFFEFMSILFKGLHFMFIEIAEYLDKKIKESI